MEENNIKINGLPDPNETFEVEVENKKADKIQNEFSKLINELTPEEMMKQLPADVKDSLEVLGNSLGLDISQLLSRSMQLSKNIIGNMDTTELDNLENMLKQGQVPLFMPDKELLKSNGEDLNPNDFIGYDDNTEESVNELNFIEHLTDPNCFAAVLCKEEKELYSKFVSKYGTGPYSIEKILEISPEIVMINSTDDAPVYAVNELELFEESKHSLIFYAKPIKENEYGLFLAIIKDVNGEFAFLIPEYANTYSTEGRLFNVKEDINLFNEKFEFSDFDLTKLKVSIEHVLCPIKRTILSPLKFGEIKTQIVSHPDDSRFLKVGKIISNESDAAILLKKDAEKDLEQLEFDFFFRLKESKLKKTLDFVSSNWVSKLDLNECLLMENTELQYCDKGFFVDIDIEDFIDNIQRWWN